MRHSETVGLGRLGVNRAETFMAVIPAAVIFSRPEWFMSSSALGAQLNLMLQP